MSIRCLIVDDEPLGRDRIAALLKAIPDAEFHAIPGAAHLPILERSSFTDSLIVAFLARTI